MATGSPDRSEGKEWLINRLASECPRFVVPRKKLPDCILPKAEIQTETLPGKGAGCGPFFLRAPRIAKVPQVPWKNQTLRMPGPHEILHFTPSFFCKLDEEVVYWNSSFFPG